MYNDASIGVVVPAFNEGPFVGDVLDTIPEFVDKVYAIDDCSTDETWMEIQARARTEVTVEATPDGGHRTHPEIIPIRHEVNRGRGAAVKTGYRRAIDDGLEIVAVMDGDGQMDPTQLDRLIDPLVSGEADYAKGNRLSRPSDWRGMSTWRLFGNVLLTQLTRIASGYWSMWDSQNGYTAISIETLVQLDFEDLFDEYGFLNDLLIQLNLHDERIADVGMKAVYGDEQSGIRYSTFVPSLSILLLTGWVRRLSRKYVLRQFHPLVIPFGLGVVGGSIAIARRLRSVIEGMEERSSLGLAPLSGFFLVVALLLDKWHNDSLVSSIDLSDEE